jgi:DNA repair exonuclease SbcCD ATPase subunit
MENDAPTPEQWRALNEKMAELREKYEKCRAQLEKYTNNDRHKRYYEQNKDRVKENAKAYLNRLKTENPEKLKEYRHRAYIKRKNSDKPGNDEACPEKQVN